MALPRNVYESILQDMELPVLACMHLGLLQHKYPGVQPDTICAISAQENQYKVLKTHHIHKAHMGTYCSRYLAGEDLLVLCGNVDFPPCLMMRRMLESMMGLSKQRVSDILKQPALLHSVDAAAALQLWQQRVTAQQHEHAHHSHAHSSTSHRQQRQQEQAQALPVVGSSSGRWEPQRLLQCLQRDVVRCVHADRSYSPYCDMAKSLAGLEHEALLYQQLSAAGIPFWSEQELRERGLFKTPDALLQVPICIKGPEGQWHMVHWIDSKASFGDDRTHTQQMEGQYATYVNRYGPGCVIYWFGYIADLSVSVQAQKLPAAAAAATTVAGAQGGVEEEEVGQVDVLLRDTFPSADEMMQLHQHVTEVGAAQTQPATAAAMAAATTSAAAAPAVGPVPCTVTG